MKSNIVYTEKQIKDLEYECDKQWTRVGQMIKVLKPFYYCMFTGLIKLGFDKTNEVMAEYGAVGLSVTPKHLVYSREFISQVEPAEIVFFSLHEITHYALLHIERKCKVEYPEVYNIAADLYVNALLIQEYNLKFDDTVRTREGNIKVYMPGDKVIFDPNININDRNVEDIYAMLIKYGMKENSNGTYSVGNNNKSVPEGSNLIKELMDAKDYEKALSEMAQDLLDKSKDIMQIISTDGQDEINGVNQDTMMDSDILEMHSLMKSNIMRALTETKMAGNGAGSLLEEFVNKVIADKIDWRKLVRKFLVEMTSKETSYRRADKRMLWFDAILPGMDTPEDLGLNNVKMCTDTSGSISREELEVFYAQLGQLCTQYKVDGELIHWDCEMQSMGGINETKELYQIGQLYGGGGTNPACLFKYFDSKQCKKKPALIIILTDGYIDFTSNEQWVRKYGKKTIWIINKCGNNHFKPPFGVVTNLSNE